MLIFAQRTQITFTLLWAWNRSLQSSRQSLEQGLSLANLILVFTATLVRALEADIRRPGLLWSALHTWLRCHLLRVLMPDMGVVLDHVCAPWLKTSDKGGTFWAPPIQPGVAGEAPSSCSPAGQTVHAPLSPWCSYSGVFSRFVSLHINTSGQELRAGCNLFSHLIWLITLWLWSSPTSHAAPSDRFVLVGKMWLVAGGHYGEKRETICQSVNSRFLQWINWAAFALWWGRTRA